MLRSVPSTYCVHQPACQGCPLSERPYAEQLESKRQRLLAALSPYPELCDWTRSNTVTAVGAEQVTAYRVRAKLVVQGTRVGLFTLENHDVVDTPHCKILDPWVQDSVRALRAQLPLPVRLLAIDVRKADRGTLLTLIVPPESDRVALEGVAARLMALDSRLLGVSFSERAPNSAQVLGAAPKPLLGAELAPHHLTPDEPYHLAVPGGFVQAHAAQAGRLYGAIEAELAKRLGALRGRRILELYAGSGALALRLAAKGAQISASDSYQPNIERLESTARAQGLALHAEATSAEAALAQIQTKNQGSASNAGAALDALLVDPPRRGLSPAVRMGIAAAAPRFVVMVSCEPATMARDLAHLVRLGYRAQRIEAWDLLPQSEAVEGLVILERAEPPTPRILYQDEHLIAVDKPPFVTTTPQSEYDSSLLRVVNQLDGAEAAVAVHRLDRDTSGVCLFARKPNYVHDLAQALAAGQKTYIALAQGVTHKKGRITKPLRDGRTLQEATTEYRMSERVGTHSLLNVFPKHGRKHQIRKHLAMVGHPLIGDTRHGKASTNRHFEERHGLDRPFLHCARIVLALPSREIRIESPLAPDLSAVLESVRSSAVTKPRS